MTEAPAGQPRQEVAEAPPRRPSRIRWHQLPWHPLLIAAVVVATLWLNAGISPYAAFRSLGVALLVAVVLTGLAAVAFRSIHVGGIAATAIIALLWSKQFVSAGSVVLGRMSPPLAIFWVGLLVLLALVVVRLVRRTARRWSAAGTTSVLNRAVGLFLAGSILVGVLNGRLPTAVADLGQGVDLASWERGTAQGEAGGPDIYAILLDGYPRADVLQFAFDYDNSDFVTALASRGFEVAPDSHSNYLWTHVSVPSALNLEYVEDIPLMTDIIADRLPRQPTIRRLIGESRAFDIVHDRGYTTVAVGSGFEEVAAREADVWVDGGELNEFEIALLSSTFAGDVVNVVAPTFAASQQADRIRLNLAVLPQIAETANREPVMVFAHVPAPHQPVVMDGAGEPIQVPLTSTFFGDSPIERGESHEEFVERYRDQLPYLNARVLDAVDGILANSTETPIILLFADHGSASRVDWIRTQPAAVDPALLLERTGILFAALTPGRDDLFPPDIAPVDMFRLLFDAYFQTDFGRAVPPPGGGHVEPIDASVLGP